MKFKCKKCNRFVKYEEENYDDIECPHCGTIHAWIYDKGWGYYAKEFVRNKFTGEDKKDIHESDIDYLTKSYNNAVHIANKYNWNKINCIEDDNLRTIESIHEEIYKLVKDNIDSMEK